MRAAAVEDAAVGHHHDALGKVRDDFHVVADHDYSAAALGHGAHGFHDGHALAVVKAARGLVEHHDFGLYDYDGGECHHLALTTREREGRLVGRQAKAVDDELGATQCLGTVDAGKLQAKGDLVEHGVLADLAVGVLEERCDLAGDTARGDGCGIQSRDAHAARGGLKQACEQLGKCGLAGAVLADDAHELAGIEGQVEVVDGGAAIGIGKLNVIEGEHGLGVLGVRAQRRCVR